jgi:hypothetical protein
MHTGGVHVLYTDVSLSINYVGDGAARTISGTAAGPGVQRRRSLSPNAHAAAPVLNILLLKPCMCRKHCYDAFKNVEV